MTNRLILTSANTLLVLLTGCFSANLPALETPPAVSRLNELADASITVTVDTAAVDGHHGYQYLTIIPITRVYTPSLATEVTDQLKVQAGLKGYRLLPPSSASQQNAFRLDVTVRELNVSGYCLLAVRRPHADILLSATLRSQNGEVLRECSGAGEVTYTAKFAFSEQLNEARRIALTTAAVSLIECLALPKPRVTR